MSELFDKEIVEEKSPAVCTVCKTGNIMIVKISGTTIPRFYIPCGPGSASYFIHENEYYCNHCKVKFQGMPETS